MEKANLLVVIGLLCFGLLLWNLYVSTEIARYINRHGFKEKIAHQRGRIFKLLPLYKELTQKELGKVGPLYSLFVISFVLFASLLTIGLILSAILN